MRFIFMTLGYHPDSGGGADRYAAELAERLAARGHRVEVVCPNPQNRLAPRETRAGVELHRCPNVAVSAALNWWRENAHARAVLSRLAGAHGEPSLFCLHHAFFGPCLHFPRLVRRLGSPVQFLYGPWHLEFLFQRQHAPRGPARRGLDWLFSRVMRQVERDVLRRVRKVLVASDYCVSRLPEWFGVQAAPVAVIPGGVNLEQFRPAPDRAARRAEWGIEPGDFLFLAVRRLDPRMGLIDLIDAFGAVASRFPQARLRVAGRGPLEGRLALRLRALGLEPRAKLLGFVPEERLPGLYAAADCTVVPSLDLEGFGLATVESLACGTPVLGSEAGATPELLAPLGDGLLFPPGRPGALAGKLEDVLAGRLALPARQACAEYARARFAWDDSVRAVEALALELHEGGA